MSGFVSYFPKQQRNALLDIWTSCKRKKTAAAERVQGPLCKVTDDGLTEWGRRRLDFNWEGILMFSFDYFMGQAFKTKKSWKKFFVIPQTTLTPQWEDPLWFWDTNSYRSPDGLHPEVHTAANWVPLGSVDTTRGLWSWGNQGPNGSQP